LTLLLALFTAAAAVADPAPTPTSKWDPARTTGPEDLNELKSLQASVEAVVDKCSPATVAVLFGPSAGSGVIVNEDGLVLTAAHVIRDYEAPKKGAMEGKAMPFTSGKSVKIMLPDGTKVDGKTLGINADMDSGMVQITTKGPNNGKWPFAPVAKSADVKKGQWVVSLGHPSGPKDGRSPVARLGRVVENNKRALRTDCTLVGGDSGGPLFDLNGRVIGIHSRIGLTLAHNYHVQADQFKKEWDQLVAGDWVDKPAAKAGSAYIGVVFPDDEEEDAWLREVESDGPADKGGLRAGDTITKFNETAVKSVKQFRKLMEGAKPGEKVKLTVRRSTDVVTLTVTLGKRA
jgi:serine protease Do